MSRGLKKQTTKQMFVDATYQMIQEDGLENLKVRNIAKRVGCTAAALYRHFESLDYLSMLASLRYLDDYLQAVMQLDVSEISSVGVILKSWKLFNKCAFENPPIFIHLFWGPYSHYLEEATTEYIQLFPTRSNENRMAYYYTAASEKSLRARDFVWLRLAAVEGYLKYDDAVYISKINDYTVHGMLMEHLEDYKEPGVAEKAAEECDAIIEKTIRDRLLKQPDI